MARARARAFQWQQQQKAAAKPPADTNAPWPGYDAQRDKTIQDAYANLRSMQKARPDLFFKAPEAPQDGHPLVGEVSTLGRILDDLEQPDTATDTAARAFIQAGAAAGGAFLGVEPGDYSKLGDAVEQVKRWATHTVRYRQERSEAAKSLGLIQQGDDFGGLTPKQYGFLLLHEGLNELARRAESGKFDPSAVEEWSMKVGETMGFAGRVFSAAGIARSVVSGFVKQGLVSMGILAAARAAQPLSQAETAAVEAQPEDERVAAEASIRGMNALREAAVLPVFTGVNLVGRALGKLVGGGLLGTVAHGAATGSVMPLAQEVNDLGFEGALKLALPTEEVQRLTDLSLLAKPEMRGPVERIARTVWSAIDTGELNTAELRDASREYAKALGVSAPAFVGLNVLGYTLARSSARPKDPRALGRLVERQAKAAIGELSQNNPKVAKQIEAFVNDQADAIKTLIDDQELGRYVIERMPQHVAAGPTRAQQQGDYLAHWKAQQDILAELKRRAMAVPIGQTYPHLGLKTDSVKGRPTAPPGPTAQAAGEAMLGVSPKKGGAAAGGKGPSAIVGERPAELAATPTLVEGDPYLGLKPHRVGSKVTVEPVVETPPAEGASESRAYGGLPITEPAIQAVGKVVDAVGEATHVAPVTRLLADPLVTTVERGGGEVGKQIAQRARVGMDETRRLMGKWHGELVRYQRSVRGPKGRERKMLEQVEWEHPLGGRTMFHRVLEGEASEAGLPAKAKEAVRGYERLYMTAGRGMEEAGTMIELREGFRPFRVTERRHMVRHPNQRGRDIAMAGSGPQFEAWVKATLEHPANQAAGITREMVEREINLLGGRDVHGRYSTEHRRVIPWMPDTIRATPDSPPVRILDTDPFTAGTALIRGAARRLGYIKAFGQDIPGQEGPTSVDLIEQYRKAGGDPQAAINLQRAMSGIPLEQTPKWAAKNQYGYHGAQIAAGLSTLWKAGKLTWSATANVFEPAGKPAAMLGYDSVAKAYVQASQHPLDTYHNLAALGAITPQVARWYLEHGAEIQSVARMGSQIGTAPFQATQRMAEVVTGQAALYVVDQMKMGKSWPALRAGLRTMGFTEAEVQQMVRGQGGELYDRFVRQAPAHLVMASPLPAEKSRAANNRYYQALTAFQSYAEGTAARVLEMVRQMREAPTPAAKRDAANLFVRNVIGAVGSGGATIALRALLAFGTLGLVQKLREAQEDPVDFASEALAYSWFGGMWEAARRAMVGETTVGQAVTGFVPALSVAQELADIYNDKGRYEGLSLIEKASTFLEGQVALAKPMKRAVAVVGLGNHDTKLDLALSTFHRFVREEGPGPATGGAPSNKPEWREFRLHMRRAADRLKEGADPDDPKLLDDLVAAAMARGSTASVARALEGRRVLMGAGFERLTDEEKERVERTLGPDLWSRLQAYDALLTALAEAFR